MYYEIWAINENWETIEEFASFEDANKFSDKFFQILYRKTPNGPIHIYKEGSK